ncbi:MAG: STM4012 family radical SAM protein [Pseudomonadales bacterium]|nr:STM4012 family radical SAM protein [Pseudomonadales bacterium]
MSSLQAYLDRQIYQAYSYSYPHKTAYRSFATPYALSDLWAGEKRDALFLYVHIPFCEMRCGFCNLFTLVRPNESLPERYLNTLERQARQTANWLGDAKFARFALGGGTPTYFSAKQLQRLFEIAYNNLGIGQDIPCSVQTSPETVSTDKLEVLRNAQVDRISIGIQSFLESETQALARRQNNRSVHEALTLIREHSASQLNIDLIYGIPGQTPETWAESLQQAMHYAPEELYLYPLYIRKQTGLERIQSKNSSLIPLHNEYQHSMLSLYRQGRDMLIAEGYEQVSMRMFRKTGAQSSAPVYCCQEDGMLGLGAGARSYTRQVHYSSEYAVGRTSISSLIQHYIEQTDADFHSAPYGITLTEDEQKRRYLIQSLLLAEGLDLDAYEMHFGTRCAEDFSVLTELEALGLAERSGTRLKLSAAGLERADALGPWLGSTSVHQRMASYQSR